MPEFFHAIGSDGKVLVVTMLPLALLVIGLVGILAWRQRRPTETEFALKPPMLARGPSADAIAQVPPDLAHRVRAELHDGERLLWVGQPRQRWLPEEAQENVFGGLVLTAFAIFWMYMGAWILFSGPDPIATSKNGPGLVASLSFLLLLGGAFLLIGVGALSTPYWLRRQAQQTCYALTDRRAILLEARESEGILVRWYGPRALGAVECVEYPDGSGDVLFAGSRGGPRKEKTESPGFRRIDHVREVEALLRQALLSAEVGIIAQRQLRLTETEFALKQPMPQRGLSADAIAQVPPDLAHCVRAELHDGERLLWVGQPRQRWLPEEAQPNVGCGLWLTAFAVLWMCGAAWVMSGNPGGKDPGIIARLFPLWGLPFLLLGLRLLSTPYWLRGQAQQTCYALTDRRAILFESQLSGGIAVRWYGPRAVGTVERVEYPDGSGDVLFAGSRGGRQRAGTESPGFRRIDHVREVEALLRQALLPGDDN